MEVVSCFLVTVVLPPSAWRGTGKASFELLVLLQAATARGHVHTSIDAHSSH